VLDGDSRAGGVGDGPAQEVAHGADISADGLDFPVVAIQADVLDGNGEVAANPGRDFHIMELLSTFSWRLRIAYWCCTKLGEHKAEDRQSSKATDLPSGSLP
jgi:hypothetical protein